MSRKPIAASAKGFDFGTPASYVGMLDTGWVEDMKESEVVGCAYGWEPVEELGGPVPSLSLVARNESSIRSAFSTFYEWAEGSDDDAVDMTIVFLNSGGYLLGISPEVKRRSAKTPVPVMLNRIEMVATWIKTMDTTDPSLIKLHSYHQSFLAPIAVGAMIFPSTGPLPSQPPSNLSSPTGLRPLIKFNISFVNEDDEQFPPAAEIIVQTHRKRVADGVNGKASEAPNRLPTHWQAKRKSVLEEMFPLTLFRACTNGLLDTARSRLASADVTDWQIEQAACNLAMSARLGAKGKHYEGIAAKKLLNRIIDASASPYDPAGGENDLGSVTVEDVIKQVRLDATYLVNEPGESARDGSLKSRQSILRRRGYLETS